jgi:aldehyde:ferredoxin oxidoreductase
MEKIFRVNLSDLSVKIEDVPQVWAGLGGRGLTSSIIAREVPPTCHPLGESNKLVFAPGFLSGTGAACSGRLSAGAKSPLTGGIKESNVGGTAAQMMARMGIKALIIEGQPEKETFYGLHVTKDSVTIAEETEMMARGNFTVINTLVEKSGKKIGVLSIGQAGEMKMASANISVKDPEGKIRSLGRGGLGAVMGAKGVKFIALDDSDAPKVSIADPETFKAASRNFAKALLADPITGEFLPMFGTAGTLSIVNAVGALPTNNFRDGQFEGHDKISGEIMYETIVERGGKHKHRCHAGCVIQCSQVYNDKKGNFVSSGFEYETIWGLGAHSQIDDLDIIAKTDYIMDDIGVDSIEMAVTIGVAMDAGILSFGDGQEAIRLLEEEVSKGTPLGRILGGGTASVGRAYGVTRVPVVKGQSIPAYDPRGLKGIGITYATSPMGADHTAGLTLGLNLDQVPGRDKAGQVALSRDFQIGTAFIDSTGLCLFTSGPGLANPEVLISMINARFGIELTPADVSEMGKTILKTEHAFNRAAGLTRADDRLPEFFREPLPPHKSVWDFTDEEIDEFWDF